MKAFLSHSSKDKYFVGQVAKALGTTQIEYDEQTFEYTLNVKAIRHALARSDLFVAFLSANSIGSSFVAEEHRAALEARGRGDLEHILIFAIDNTSYKMLPEWLREINVVQQLSSP
ncbi:MAG: TIR domain-containing protein [Rhodospirillales bacterium]|nr:TIR domain-containing protein [Rhodospirillales bacterium]